MGRVMGRVVLMGAALAAVMAPSAAWSTVVADWEMNEPGGASVMVDSSGNGLDGQIGSQVITGSPVDSGFAYTFPRPGAKYNPNHLVSIPDTAQLDPGTQPYAVTIRLRTSASDPNIVQKGQSGQTGGYWKLVEKKGWARCHFRDSRGVTKAIGFVDGDRSLKIDDNQWHTIRCERTATGVQITQDAGTPEAASKFIRGTLGTIDNRRPFSIGGKTDCARPDVGCDYFTGQIDFILVERP